MPVGIQQPSNQIKLTNVAIVRLKKGKKRFEIACYRNQLLDYKNKVTENVDDILQIERIFVNVNKGEFANESELTKAFDGKKKPAIIKEILDFGTFQVGEQERHAQIDRVHKEVIDMVASKLVDPKTKRVYTTGIIEKALDQLSSQAAAQSKHEKPQADGEEGDKKGPVQWRGVVPNKDTKKQASVAINALIAYQPIPVMKAQMRIRVTCPTSIVKRGVETAPAPAPTVSASKSAKNKGNKKPGKQAEAEPEEMGEHTTVKDKLLSFLAKVERQDIIGDEWEVEGSIDPGDYKHLNEFLGAHTKGRGKVEVLDMAVKQGEE